MTGPTSVRRLERWAINDCARVLYRILKRQDAKIVLADFDSASEDVAMVYAIGERAAELREAFKVVQARHAGDKP